MAKVLYKCPDGVERKLDSKGEVEFIEYCVKNGIKILEYNTDKHKKFELIPKPPKTIKSKPLEKLLMRKGFLYDIEPMRNMEHTTKSFDFHIELNGVECLVEIKSEWTNRERRSFEENQYYTSWAMAKTIMAEKYQMPIIVFIAKSVARRSIEVGRLWRAEYFIPEKYKDAFDA